MVDLDLSFHDYVDQVIKKYKEEHGFVAPPLQLIKDILTALSNNTNWDLLEMKSSEGLVNMLEYLQNELSNTPEGELKHV